MAEIRNLTRNGETFYPLTHEKAVIGMEDFKDTITEQIDNYRPIEITGDVVNAPDEEDITSDNNLLKFKNRNNLYGLGKVILRRGSSFASQVTQANTIYVIQYNFDLDSARINIPNGSILLFEGGTLSNGTLVCADLYDVRLVYYQDQSEILSSVTLEGNFIHKACDKDTIRQILVDNSSITKDINDVLSVKANGIQNSHLNSNVVDNSGIVLDSNNKISIKDGGVTGSKLNSGIVNTDDLSIVSNKIQLADRGTTNGIGMIILRKDLSFASQLTQTNTIYIIRYNFTLTSNVTIPANCILKFEGGSLNGGTININGALVLPSYNDLISGTNLTITGSPKIGTFKYNTINVSPEWFDGNEFAFINKSFEVTSFNGLGSYDGTQSKFVPSNKCAYLIISSKVVTRIAIRGGYEESWKFRVYGNQNNPPQGEIPWVDSGWRNYSFYNTPPSEYNYFIIYLAKSDESDFTGEEYKNKLVITTNDLKTYIEGVTSDLIGGLNLNNFGDITVESIDSNEIPRISGDKLIKTGTIAPNTAPDFIGQVYIDTNNKNIYTAVGTSSSNDYIKLN